MDFVQKCFTIVLLNPLRFFSRKKRLNWAVVEVSAKKDVNISDIFTVLFKQWWKGSEENKDDSDLKLHRTVSMKVWSADSSASSRAASSDKQVSTARVR